MYGFISAMMAAAVWLTVATRLGLPVSTTHSIIGGIIGVGLVLEVQHQTDLIDWEVVRKVVMSWVASPLLGATIAFLSFWIVRETILESKNPEERSMGWRPSSPSQRSSSWGLPSSSRLSRDFLAGWTMQARSTSPSGLGSRSLDLSTHSHPIAPRSQSCGLP